MIIIPKTLGTPKNINEAVMNLMHVMLNCPMRDLPEPGTAVIRDFLAQRFGVAMLQHPEQEELLKQLFNEIVAAPADASRP